MDMETDAARLRRLTAELAEVQRRLGESPENPELLAQERRLDGALQGYRLKELLARLRCAAVAKWN
jgi:hypothetical protein